MAPHLALLMPLRAKKFILMVQKYQQKVICESRPGHLYDQVLGVSFVKNGFQFVVQIRRVFPDLITDSKFARQPLIDVLTISILQQPTLTKCKQGFFQGGWGEAFAPPLEIFLKVNQFKYLKI